MLVHFRRPLFCFVIIYIITYYTWYKMADPHMNPDLQKERSAALISKEEVACLIHGGSEGLTRKRRIADAVYNNLEHQHVPYDFLNDEEKLEEGIRRNVELLLKKPSIAKDKQDKEIYEIIFELLGFRIFLLHEDVFTPTIEKQGTPEQRDKWLPLCYNKQILGAYAQTELGHGTFVRGLETTAHYDPHTQEFIINSPTISSMKWWPGAIASVSTHAVVLAQLYTLGKCRGIHTFIVQLRSLKDHKPLPDLSIGSIGPRFGAVEGDNGYIKFDNYRIPRENMLMRYSAVAPDGSYSKTTKANLTYGTLTYNRAKVVQTASIALAKGATIAVRYSAVRRQSEMRPGEPEPQVLSYQTQQHKILPLLATAYAFHFVRSTMMKTYHDVDQEVSAGDFSRLQELHALSSGLKAFTTWSANSGLEVLRMSCGGHGYSKASGFPQLYSQFTPTCTLEGENTILMLQSARYLVKCVRQVKSETSSFPGTVAYLESELATSAWKSDRDFHNLDFLENLYRERAYKQVYFASFEVDASMKSGLDLVGSLNKSAINLVKAANAHSNYFVVKMFVQSLKTLSASPQLYKAMKELCLLYSLDGIDKSSGDFLEDGLMTGSEVKKVRQHVVDLLPLVRVNAVTFVDAFEFDDKALGSVLGREDGNVYANLYKWAQHSTLNKTDVHSSYYKYLRPLLKGNESKL